MLARCEKKRMDIGEGLIDANNRAWSMAEIREEQNGLNNKAL